jgi:hypothetical protein
MKRAQGPSSLRVNSQTSTLREKINIDRRNDGRATTARTSRARQTSETLHVLQPQCQR